MEVESKQTAQSHKDVQAVDLSPIPRPALLPFYAVCIVKRLRSQSSFGPVQGCPLQLHFFGERWFLDVLAFQVNTQTQMYKVNNVNYKKLILQSSQWFFFFCCCCCFCCSQRQFKQKERPPSPTYMRSSAVVHFVFNRSHSVTLGLPW